MGEMNHLSHMKLSVGIINIKCLGLFLKYNKHSVSVTCCYHNHHNLYH